MAICTVTTPSLRGWKQGETVDLSGDVGEPGDPDVFNERTPIEAAGGCLYCRQGSHQEGRAAGGSRACSEHRSIQTQGNFWLRLTSAEGFTSVSQVFVME